MPSDWLGSARWPIAGCLICAGCLIVLVALVYLVAPIERLDARILGEFVVPPGSSADFVASLFERLADPLPQLVLVASVCLVAWRRRRPRLAVVAVALVAGAALITQLLKILLAHPRYHAILGDRQVGSNGFPSGHSAGAMSMALALFVVVPRSWKPSVAVVGGGLTVAVGASLVVLSLHYPSDILGGWLVTAGWCFALLAVGVAWCHRASFSRHRPRAGSP